MPLHCSNKDAVTRGFNSRANGQRNILILKTTAQQQSVAYLECRATEMRAGDRDRQARADVINSATSAVYYDQVPLMLTLQN